MTLKTIKEVTKLTGATESALRYYEKKGIVSPTVKRTEGRREWLYDDNAVSKLKKVFLYKQIGLSINEIKEAVNDENKKVELLTEYLKRTVDARELLDMKIFIARILLLDQSSQDTNGKPDGNLQMQILAEMIKEKFYEEEEK